MNNNRLSGSLPAGWASNATFSQLSALELRNNNLSGAAVPRSGASPVPACLPWSMSACVVGRVGGNHAGPASTRSVCGCLQPAFQARLQRARALVQAPSRHPGTPPPRCRRFKRCKRAVEHGRPPALSDVPPSTQCPCLRPPRDEPFGSCSPATRACPPPTRRLRRMLGGNPQFCGPVPPLLRPAVSAAPRHSLGAHAATAGTVRPAGQPPFIGGPHSYGTPRLRLQVCEDFEASPSKQCTDGKIVCQGQA